MHLTDGQTGSPPDWFARSARPTKGPPWHISHCQLGTVTGGGASGHMQVLLHFPTVLDWPSSQYQVVARGRGELAGG